MKRWLGLALMLLLFLTVASACGEREESRDTSSESRTVESSTEKISTEENSREESGTEPEWLVNFGDRALYGSLERTKDDTFDAVDLTRTDDEEEQEAASFAFALSRSTDSEYLSVTGSVAMVNDAAALFDFYIEEDEEGETADPYADTSDAGTYLSDMITALLAETDENAELKTLSANGIDWKYGFAAYTQEEGGSSVLNFYAFACPEDLVIYVNAGAYVSGGDHADTILEKAEEGYTEWLKSLKTGEAELLPEDE